MSAAVAPCRWGLVTLVALTCPTPAVGQTGGLQSEEAQTETESTPINEGSPVVWGRILGGIVPADMVQSAADLRVASEAAERWAVPLSRSIEAIVASMAEMSSGFDPLGHQASAKTMLRQTEIIAEQQRTIERLQQEEIDRLEAENQRLRRRLERWRKRAATKQVSDTVSSFTKPRGLSPITIPTGGLE